MAHQKPTTTKKYSSPRKYDYSETNLKNDINTQSFITHVNILTLNQTVIIVISLVKGLKQSMLRTYQETTTIKNI